MSTKIISIADIDIKGSPHVRGEYRQEVAEEYAIQYRLKSHGMPKPVLFQSETIKPALYYVADGMHRIEAMKLAGRKEQAFEVIKGSWHDCVKYALKANVANGIRRSNADKRACVMLALKEFPKLSNGALSDACAVGDDLVASVRKELDGVIPKFEKRTGKDGRETTAPKAKHEAESKVEKAQVVAGFGVDATGYPHTQQSVKYWGRADEIKDLLGDIAIVERALKDAKRNKDLLFSEVNFNSMESDLDRISAGLALAMPYAVCPSCSGKLVDTCKLCRGRGVISKFLWDTGVPKELKKIRGAK